MAVPAAAEDVALADQFEAFSPMETAFPAGDHVVADVAGLAPGKEATRRPSSSWK